MRSGIEMIIEKWKQSARRVKAETQALFLAYQHPQTPWYAKAFAGLVIAYALSPIDLVPDFIPVLGYLDDMVLVPLGIALAIRMIPDAVMVECRAQVEMGAVDGKHTHWIGAVIIILFWLALAALIFFWLKDRLA